MAAEGQDAPDDAHNSADIAAEDPESYFSSRRLRTIHDARDRAREVRSAVRDPTTEIDQFTANRFYRVEVDNYLSEIEPLADQVLDGDDVDDTLVDYWQHNPLGTVTVAPPTSLIEAINDDKTRVIGTPSLPKRTHDIIGLNAYLDAPEVFVEEYSVHVRKKHEGKVTLTERAMAEIPTAVSLAAFRTANLFLADIGLHVDVEESEHRAVITDELMEEVEEWRQQNIE